MHLDRLIEQAARRLRSQGSWQLAQLAAEPLDRLLIIQQHCTTAFDASLYEPVLCLILQGRKQVSIGAEVFSFGPGECLLVSHDLPVRSRITKVPYLALVFEVDVTTIRKLYDEVTESALESEGARAAETHRADPGLLDALGRYLALCDAPLDAKVLGPLISKEIHYRMLMAPFGAMLRSLILHDSNASAIARAISHIRADLRATIAIPELARRVGMSASSFHKNFKAVASTSPLQYQKELRLLEARRLLKMGGTSVTSAALEVGYASASQFSREYARKYGVPPSQETVSATFQDETP